MRAGVAALLVALLVAACGDDKPAHDPELWQRAKDSAGLYCAMSGVGGTDANAIYTDEFRNCVADRTPVEYRELEGAGK